jgi:hypothetical protein
LKTKFVALSVLVLLFAGMFLSPAMSYEPPTPDPDPCWLAFFPQEYKFTGPCTESTHFESTVVLYNVEANEMNLYAWDFKVKWDPTLLELVDHEMLFPPGWVEGVDYVVLFDENGTDTWDFLHIAATKIGNETGFIDDRIELLWLEFHIIYEPVWHIGCITTELRLRAVSLAMWTDSCGAPMDCTPEDASVGINPSRPNMEITFSPDSPVEEKIAQGWIENDVMTAYLWVSNVTKFYDLRVCIMWDPDLLRIDYQQIFINEETFPPPWSLMKLDLNATAGTLQFWIERPCEKPPLKGTFWILQMDFKVKCYVDEWGVPIPGDTLIRICGAQMSFKDAESSWVYYPGDEEQSIYCIKISHAEYFWTPIPGDFNQDGHVGVDDILIMAEHYGMDGSWDVVGDDDVVDIYDIIWVAKRYCNSTPPPLE